VVRGVLCGVMLVAAAVNAAAQGGEPLRPSRQLFTRLFTVPPRARLPAVTPPRPIAREVLTNRECAGCDERPGLAHLVVESPRITNAWLARHTYQANGGAWGDNAVVADFWYDGVHRRVFTRSLELHEVEDPADLRLGRAPGKYPNAPDLNAALDPGTTVGHVGFVRWTASGFGSYFAAVQGAVRDGATGYLDLSTATGTRGTTRTGSMFSGEDLVKHVRLHPSGQLEVGFETDPAARPDTALLVRGNAAIEGALTVGGAAIVPPRPFACTVQSAAGSGRRAAVSCGAGQLATGGGGTCASGELRAMRPLAAGGAPDGWELTCTKDGAHTAYVICCAQ
jgi:hypothetical protein